MVLCAFANAAVTATPEPATVGTLTIGLGAFGVDKQSPLPAMAMARTTTLVVNHRI